MSQPLNIELLAAFMTIATSANPAKINEAIQQLEQRYSDYLNIIYQFVDMEPEVVLVSLNAQYPEFAKAMSSPLAPRAVERIQNYLKQKGNENAD